MANKDVRNVKRFVQNISRKAAENGVEGNGGGGGSSAGSKYLFTFQDVRDLMSKVVVDDTTKYQFKVNVDNLSQVLQKYCLRETVDAYLTIAQGYLDNGTSRKLTTTLIDMKYDSCSGTVSLTVFGESIELTEADTDIVVALQNHKSDIEEMTFTFTENGYELLPCMLLSVAEDEIVTAGVGIPFEELTTFIKQADVE